jgi:ElaB/YqjD/DUF883 family membrane-anchored ribosome-binding protein
MSASELLEAPPSLDELRAKAKAEVEKLAVRMADGEWPQESEIKTVCQEAGVSLDNLQRYISFQNTVRWERERWQTLTDTEDELKNLMAEREKLLREDGELAAEEYKQFGHRRQVIDYEISQFNRKVEQIREARLTARVNALAATDQLNKQRALLEK